MFSRLLLEVFGFFQSIAFPLTTETQKCEKVEWSEACERNIQMLKDSLSSTRVLTLLEGLQGFVVYWDPSRVVLGSVLMQHEKVIAYSSKQHKVHAKKISN